MGEEKYINMMKIDEVIRDISVLEKAYINRDGFIFSAITEPANIYDAIVIRAPENADIVAPKRGFSNHSLEEHIKLINEYKLEKAIIIAEDIHFVLQCPTLKYLNIFPANTAADDFDFSPLYEMPEIRDLSCQTVYGDKEQYSGCIDYSRIKGLLTLGVYGQGHLNYNQVFTLKDLHISNYTGKRKDLTNLFTSSQLENLTLIQCGIQSLNGIEYSEKISRVSLAYNRSLKDISDLRKVAATLKVLSIEACAKINDFSCLNELVNLEYLELFGSNEIPNLNFIKNMKKLKVFVFDMNVLDGDLSPCLDLSYVYCGRSRRHYNLKDKDLPKEKN